MSRRQEVALWGSIAVLALAALGSVVRHQSNSLQRRVAIQVAPQPARGEALFRDKGCEGCHGAGGAGGQRGPALRQSPTLATLPRLVAAMWNHAPRMWQSMRAEHVPYPALDNEDAGQLVAYLYLSGHADDRGDAARGRQVFVQKQCVRCHDGGGRGAPDLADSRLPATPVAWTQVLWNHGAAMQQRMSKAGVAWPRFQADDLRDLFAYVQQLGGVAPRAAEIDGDPARGWAVFQEKGCLACHAVSREGGSLGPAFGRDHPMPPTFAQFGEAMLNHFPQMQRAINSRAAAIPSFSGSEMADLAAFLYSLHFLEPSGSPQIGASLFTWRGCAQCHGAQAQGTRAGPALRGTGTTYTSVRLASALWRHGAEMYRASQAAGRPWPTLKEEDVGDLLAFLNTAQ